MDVEGTGTPRLRLLGELEVTSAGEVLTLSAAAQRVLALLAVVHRGRPANRVTVAETLWLDSSGDRAVSNLRATLWRMPRPRGRALVIGTARTVQLAPEVVVDHWEAEAQLGEADVPIDVRLLQHDLLPYCYEEWLEVEREEFRQCRLHALERAAQSLRDRGRYADALSAALSAVRAEPLRETAHRRVIEIHLAEGNQSEAVRQYQHYQGLLGDQLGLPPSEALRSVMAPFLRRPGRQRARAAS